MKFLIDPFPGGLALAEYVSRYRRSDVAQLEVGQPLDLFPSKASHAAFAAELNWEHPWPFGDRAGVYMIYSDELELLYVGKASMGACLGKRLYDYFRAGDECVIQQSFWPKPPRYVINIAVPHEMPFEAPALEEFLIRELEPVCNVCGKAAI